MVTWDCIKILYQAFDIKEQTEMNIGCLKNIMPVLEVKARHVGGSNYQVPIEVRPDRRPLGLRWLDSILDFVVNTMSERLAKEIMDVNNTGAAVKKREDT